MNANQQTLDKIKEYINNNYNPSHCGYTELRSEGNGNDIFNDGCSCGKSWELYLIANIIGMRLEAPEESDDEY